MTIFSFSTISPPFGLVIFSDPDKAATLVDLSGSVCTATRVFSPGRRVQGIALIVTCRDEAAAWIALACSGAGFDARPSRKSDDRSARDISDSPAPCGRGLMITSAFW